MPGPRPLLGAKAAARDGWPMDIDGPPRYDYERDGVASDCYHAALPRRPDGCSERGPLVTQDAMAADSPVTHITTFRLSDGAPEGYFIGLWTQIGNLMSGRSGFVSARLYRPLVGGTPGEYIHVAQWTRAALLADAQSDPEIRSLEARVETLVTSRRRVVCDAATDAILPGS
jgi:hypothetical protein